MSDRKDKDPIVPNPDLTAEPSTLDLGLAGATARNLGYGSTGGQTPASPGRSAGAMGISSELAYMAGITGTGLSQDGTLTGAAELEGILDDGVPFDDTAGLSAADRSPDLGAQVAGTAGGASAGANDGAVGDLESTAREEADEEPPAPLYNLDVIAPEEQSDADEIEDLVRDVGSGSRWMPGGFAHTGVWRGPTSPSPTKNAVMDEDDEEE